MISDKLAQQVDQQIALVYEDACAFRKQCHQQPEMTWNEKQTGQRIGDLLGKIDGLRVEKEVAKYGVVATLQGGQPGPVVALRADMDALPIDERSNLPYRSVHPGVMHACGHDGHMANLYGAVLILSKLRSHIHGTVKFIFQPAEEGGAGAKVMCEQGVLDAPEVDAIFGLHGWPEAPCGHIWTRPGPILAANTQIKMVITGTGCHAAMPHLGTDQVLIAARIIEQLQSVSSRSVAPSEPVALTFTMIKAGDATNIIPRAVELKGTLRTVSQETTERCCEKIKTMVHGICQAHGVSAELDFQHVYPPTVNSQRETQFVLDTAKSFLPAESVKSVGAPSMGAEDFSFYLEKKPGCFFFLGLDDSREGGYPSLHHPSFDFNDEALKVGIKMFSYLGLSFGARGHH